MAVEGLGYLVEAIIRNSSMNRVEEDSQGSLSTEDKLLLSRFVKILNTHHSVLEGLLNENNSSRYGVHVFPPKKPRGKGAHIQSNLRSKDFEDIASFMR